MLNKFKIGNKLFLGFGLLILLIVAFGVFNVIEMKLLSQEVDKYVFNDGQIRKSKEVLKNVEEINTIFTEAIFTARTGEEAEKYYKSVQRLIEELITAQEENKKLNKPLKALDQNLKNFWQLGNKMLNTDDWEEQTELRKKFNNQSEEIIRTINQVISTLEKRNKDRITEINGLLKRNFKITVAMVISVTIIAIVAGLLITRSITIPLTSAINFAQEIAQKNLAVETLKIKSKDEVGELGRTLNEMRDNLQEIVARIFEVVEDLSAYSEELSASAQQGNATIESTNQQLEEMMNRVQQISTASQEVSELAEQANYQSEEGNDKVKETIDNINNISQEVNSTVGIIEKLDSTSREVGEIVGMIAEIAEQTNLLALNASIEAARAGEHGQGFAVVAEEIRELAEKTANATQQVTNLVENIQQKSNIGLKAVKKVENTVQEGKSIVEDTGKVFSKIRGSVENTSNEIEGVSDVAQNLAKDSREIGEASRELTNMSQEVTNSAQELANMAQNLQQMVEGFKVEIIENKEG